MNPIATSIPAPELVNVKAICQSLLEAIAARATKQRVTVDVALAPEPAWVVAIPGLLRGALHWLMLRALRSMPHGGTLSMLVHRRDGKVVTEFADTGVDVSTNVSAARVAIGAIGGSLTQTPGGDRGTRFVVEIPAAAPDRASLGPPCKDRRVAALDTREPALPTTASGQ